MPTACIVGGLRPISAAVIHLKLTLRRWAVMDARSADAFQPSGPPSTLLSRLLPWVLSQKTLQDQHRPKRAAVIELPCYMFICHLLKSSHIEYLAVGQTLRLHDLL